MLNFVRENTLFDCLPVTRMDDVADSSDVACLFSLTPTHVISASRRLR